MYVPRWLYWCLQEVEWTVFDVSYSFVEINILPYTINAGFGFSAGKSTYCLQRENNFELFEDGSALERMWCCSHHNHFMRSCVPYERTMCSNRVEKHTVFVTITLTTSENNCLQPPVGTIEEFIQCSTYVPIRPLNTENIQITTGKGDLICSSVMEMMQCRVSYGGRSYFMWTPVNIVRATYFWNLNCVGLMAVRIYGCAHGCWYIPNRVPIYLWTETVLDGQGGSHRATVSRKMRKTHRFPLSFSLAKHQGAYYRVKTACS